MEIYNINDFVRGWIVGDFKPSLFKTTDVEVAVQHFRAGDFERSHCHKIATEITVIVSGVAKMNGVVYCSGDIIKIPPNTYTDFEAVVDTVTTVIKLPGALDDKYTENE